jgi:hypothetical protein
VDNAGVCGGDGGGVVGIGVCGSGGMQLYVSAQYTHTRHVHTCASHHHGSKREGAAEEARSAQTANSEETTHIPSSFPKVLASAWSGPVPTSSPSTSPTASSIFPSLLLAVARRSNTFS